MSKWRKWVAPAIFAVAAASLAACEPVRNQAVTRDGSSYTITWDDPDCAAEGSCQYYNGAYAFILDGQFNAVTDPCIVPVGGVNSCTIDVSAVAPGNYYAGTFAYYDYQTATTDNGDVTPPWATYDPDQLQADFFKCIAPNDQEAWDASQTGGPGYEGGWHLISENCTVGAMTFGASLTIAADGTVMTTTGGVTVPTTSAPDAPGAPSAVAGDGQATVTWTAPENDGGAAITGYTVTAYPGGNICTTTADLSCTVTGLTNGTAYTFTVTATNSAGTSVASAASTAVTPQAVTPPPPSVPMNLGSQDDFTVVAVAPRAAVMTTTEYNETHLSNGSEWYFVAGYGSFGFAPAEMTINQSSADVTCIFDSSKDGCGQRLSWHTNVNGNGKAFFRSGWRAGSHVWLQDYPGSFRAIYESNNPTYYPRGPQNNVSQATIAEGGWTLCFAEDYTNEGTVAEDVFAACDGDYLLVGGLAGVETNLGGPTATVAGKPTDVTAVGGDGQARVSFTAPADNGGADIEYYTVTASPGGATCQASPETMACTVSGLTNGTKYTFTVTAHNSAGESDPSYASAGVWVHSGDFQIAVERTTVAMGGTTMIYTFGAQAGKTVNLRIGGQKVALTADENGEASYLWTADPSAGNKVLVGRKILVRANFKNSEKAIVSAASAIFVPKLSMRTTFRQGRAIGASYRSVAPGSAVEFVNTDADGNSKVVCEFIADDSGRGNCGGSADTPGDFTLTMQVDGVVMASVQYSVIARSGLPN